MLSTITISDAPFEASMNSIYELPGIKFSVLRITASARFVKRMAVSTGTEPVTELISDFNAVRLDGPGFLDHTTIPTGKAEGATVEVHRFQTQFGKHSLHGRFVP